MDRGDRRNRAVGIFVVTALGLACLHALIVELSARGLLASAPPREFLNIARSFGPALAALLAAAYLGRPALLELRRRITHWRVPIRIYVLAVLVPVAAMSCAIVISGLVHSEVAVDPQVQGLRLAAIFVILPFLDGPLGEEIGWRGFLTPVLLQRRGALTASAIVGVVWFVWHLPLYYADGRDLSGVFLAKYFVYTLALSLIHTWLLQRSGQSVVIPVLFHNATNFVVLAGFTLFPAVRELTLDNNLYLTLMLAAGGAAAIALRPVAAGRTLVRPA